MNVYGIGYLCIFACFVIVFLYERKTGNGLFVKYIKGKPILEALKLLVKACYGVFPSAHFDVAEKIVEACVDATVKAEEMWKSGEIDKEKRPEYCQAIIAKALEEAGIEVTDQIQNVIAGTIAIVCMLMPHSAKE